MYCVDVIPQRIYNGGQMAKARSAARTYHSLRVGDRKLCTSAITTLYCTMVQSFRLHRSIVGTCVGNDLNKLWCTHKSRL